MAIRARAFIGVGGNLGDRLSVLSAAVTELTDSEEIELVARSSLHETRSVGPSTEPFLNGVIEVTTVLDPEELLARLMTVEDSHGRQRVVRWGPRTVDLDLLVYLRGDVHVAQHSDTLQLPHPRMAKRDWVLVPLAELDDQLVIADGFTASQLAAELPDTDRTILRTFAPADAW